MNYTIVYDTELKRPACALLQAIYGGSTEALNSFFDSTDWLVTQTIGMRTLQGNQELWQKVAKITIDNRKIL